MENIHSNIPRNKREYKNQKIVVNTVNHFVFLTLKTNHREAKNKDPIHRIELKILNNNILNVVHI